MTVKIRLFAMMAEYAGERQVTLYLPAQAAVSEVHAAMKGRFPGLIWPAGTLVAVNQEYVAAESSLQEGDEVAIIPPVSGG